MVDENVGSEDRLIGYDVVDRTGNKVGTVENLWVDAATRQPEFLGVKTGWILGRTHVVPARDAQIDDSGQAIRIPYEETLIKDAPNFSADQNLSESDESHLYRHFGIERSHERSPTGLPGRETAPRSGGAERDVGEEARMATSEEQLRVGKERVEEGGVRLRKVVRTERQEVPVELEREEVHVERVPPSGAADSDDAFSETEQVITTSREEPVVGKERVVTGEVRAYKTTETERRDVGGEVRKEDVEVDEDVNRTRGRREDRI